MVTYGAIHDYQGSSNVHGHIEENGTADLVAFTVPVPQQPPDWNTYKVGTKVSFDKVCQGVHCHAENIQKV